MRKRGIIMMIFALVVICWVLWANTAVEITEYEITSDRIPDGFSGFRIVQISDLHNAEFGDNNEALLNLLLHSAPDVIVITGDLIDSRNTDIAVALDFCRLAIEIAPVYYTSGNHEARVDAYNDLKISLEEAGVVVLENEKLRIERNGEYITLIGIQDPSFTTDYLFGDATSVVETSLQELLDVGGDYTILLSHRPELFDVYVDSQIDLVFSGHAHGGQIQLPFAGGLIAPNQGFFPKYDAGMFREDFTTMIVSKGVGNSIIPLRINNRPELVVVDFADK